jgi:hypothetical protein
MIRYSTGSYYVIGQRKPLLPGHFISTASANSCDDPTDLFADSVADVVANAAANPTADAPADKLLYGIANTNVNTAPIFDMLTGRTSNTVANAVVVSDKFIDRAFANIVVNFSCDVACIFACELWHVAVGNHSLHAPCHDSNMWFRKCGMFVPMHGGSGDPVSATAWEAHAIGARMPFPQCFRRLFYRWLRVGMRFISGANLSAESWRC